jgi:hypothetical protein
LATNYPTSKDNLTNPAATESMEGHAALHGNVNDAIEAIETKLGINGSNDVNSIDYKVAQLQTSLSTLDAENASEILGLEGNNDLTVYGIENATSIDSFAKSAYRTVKYTIQVVKNTDVYTSEILASHNGTDIMVSESNIISNTNTSLFTYAFEENSGIISLIVTPVSGSISVRFIRTAIKA